MAGENDMPKLYAVQLDIVWEDKPANFRKVETLLDRISIEVGSMIVLPEMFATGFSMNVAEIADSPEGETDRFLSRLAQNYQSVVVGGLVTRSPDGRGWNEAAAFDSTGREIARYSKMHPFSYAGETHYYVPGERIVTFPWGDFTAASFICCDLRFPEVFRHAVQRKTGLFVVLACWPQAREEHWITLLQARAIENQAYVVGVNRCGNDPTLTYSGRSRIIDPRGTIVAEAGDAEGIIQAEADFAALAAYRREFPALEDIRTEYRKE